MRRNARKTQDGSTCRVSFRNAEERKPIFVEEYVHHKHHIPQSHHFQLICFLTRLVAVSLANGVERTTAEEIVVGGHEVGVASDGGLAVKVGHGFGQEGVGGSLISNTTGIRGESELSDPDLGKRVAAGSVDGLLDESLELIDGGAVPVNGQTSQLARCALIHEGLHPAQTLAIIGGGRDSRRDELGLAGVRGDVVLVVAGGIGGRHIGLAGDIRLVETQDILATARKSSLNSGNPTTEVLGTPEHRDEVNTLGQVARQGHSPVVSPSDVTTVGHGGNGRDIVVSSTALASAALLDLDGGSQSSGGHKAGSEQLGEGNHFACCCLLCCCSWIDPKMNEDLKIGTIRRSRETCSRKE